MLLLDTHIMLWYFHNSDKLNESVKEKISCSEHVFLSIASLWEIAIKKTIKKLDIPETVTEIADMCKKKDIEIIPIKCSYLEKIQEIPLIHNDPFDRLIIATSIEEGLTLVTDDGLIKRYDIQTL